MISNICKYICKFFYKAVNKKSVKSCDLQKVMKWKGKKILHMSDTPYGSFEYVNRVIREVKPDVIIHTGDMVDDMKIGRIPEKLEDYKKCIPELLHILQKSKAEQVYLVPGNHDDIEYLRQKAPWAKILPEGSIIVLEKVRIGLAHMKVNIPTDAQYFLYGHGLTGDNWKPESNVMGKKCFFNGVLHMHLLNIQEEQVVYIPYPKNIEFMRSGKL